MRLMENLPRLGNFRIRYHLIIIVSLIFFASFNYCRTTSSDHIYNITKLSNSTGIYYEKLGNLNVYNDHWKFLTFISLNNFYLKYKNIQFYFSEIIKICNSLRNNDIEPQECLQFVISVNNTVADLTLQTNMLYDLIGKTHVSKTKRALINAIGEISKQLFGTLSDSDAKYYDNQIEHLKKNENHIMELLKQQTSISENTLDNFVTINSQIKTFKESLDAFSSFVDNVNKVEINSTHLNKYLFKISEIFSTFILISEKYMIELNNLVSIVLYAERGQLHPLIVTPSKLLTELLKVQPHLELHQTFPVSLDRKNIDLFYKFIDVNIYFYKDKLNFMLNIPLITTQTYDLYKMSIIPLYIKENLYTFILPEKSFLSIDQMKRNYFLIDENVINKCFKLPNSRFVCQQTFPIFVMNDNSGCEAKLFSLPSVIPDSCDQRILSLNNSIFIQLSTINSWLFICPKPEVVNMNYKEENVVITLISTGILKTKPGTIAYTDSVILSSKQNFSSEINVSEIIMYTPPNQIILPQLYNLKFSKTISQKKALLYSDQILNLDKFSHKISTLREEVDKTNLNNDSSFYSISFHHITIYTFIAVVSLGIIAYLLWVKLSIVLGKTKQPSNKELEEEPGEELVTKKTKRPNPKARK